MAGRIRSIKPEMLEDEKIAELSDGAFRVWTSLMVLVDDHGNGRAKPGYLVGQIFWAQRARGESPRIAEFLGELLESKRLVFYHANGQLYCSFPTWKRHQRIDNAGKPRVPGPDSEGTVVIQTVDELNGFLSGETRGNSPRNSANRGDLPPDLRPPTSDHDHDQRPGARGEPPAPVGGDSEVTKVRNRLQELHFKATGAAHTWSGKEGGMVTTLLRFAARGGAPEVIRRMEHMYSPQCPGWIAKSRDLSALVNHWNKLAPSGVGGWAAPDVFTDDDAGEKTI